MSNDAHQQSLRIVAFNVLPFAYGVVSGWAQRHNHQLVSLITTPGPSTRRNTSYRDIIPQLPPDQEVLITTKVKNLVPYLTALAPDFIISFTFPYLLPPEVLAVPRLGAVNLHPTQLPAYRGPNPLRPIYDGAPNFAATLHWTDGSFDTGPILSQLTRPIPHELTAERIRMGLFEVTAATLEAGMARAIAGDTGTLQSTEGASYAAQFSADDELLAWDVPAHLFQRQVLSLMIVGHLAKVVIDGTTSVVQQVQLVDGAPHATPGQVLAHTDNSWTVAVADGAVTMVLASVV